MHSLCEYKYCVNKPLIHGSCLLHSITACVGQGHLLISMRPVGEYKAGHLIRLEKSQETEFQWQCFAVRSLANGALLCDRLEEIQTRKKNQVVAVGHSTDRKV